MRVVGNLDSTETEPGLGAVCLVKPCSILSGLRSAADEEMPGLGRAPSRTVHGPPVDKEPQCQVNDDRPRVAERVD